MVVNLWWLWLVAGVSWIVIALVVLQLRGYVTAERSGTVTMRVRVPSG